MERAAQLRPDDYTSLQDLCMIHAMRGDREKMLSIGKRLLLPRVEAELRRRPDNAEAAAVLANCFVELGDFVQAEDWAKRAIKLEPDAFGVRYDTACVFALLGKPDAALENLEHIYSRTPRMRRWLSGLIETDTQLDPLRSDPKFLAFHASRGTGRGGLAFAKILMRMKCLIVALLRPTRSASYGPQSR